MLVPGERKCRLARARVLLADDNALLAARIRELLAETFDVVGVVGNGEDLETAFEALAPEVVVTDVVMPGEGGLLAARRILRRHPGTPIVLLSVIGEAPVIRASSGPSIPSPVCRLPVPTIRNPRTAASPKDGVPRPPPT